MRGGLDHAGWLRRYARGVRRAARHEGSAGRRREMGAVAARLTLAADELEALAAGRVRFGDYARVEDAAGRLGVHVESVRRWLRAGRLRGERVGTVWLIRRDDLEEFARGYSWGGDDGMV